MYPVRLALEALGIRMFEGREGHTIEMFCVVFALAKLTTNHRTIVCIVWIFFKKAAENAGRTIRVKADLAFSEQNAMSLIDFCLFIPQKNYTPVKKAGGNGGEKLTDV